MVSLSGVAAVAKERFLTFVGVLSHKHMTASPFSASTTDSNS